MDDIHRLLIYLMLAVARAAEQSTLCGSDFADVQSRAALASIVLEASVDTTFERNENHRFNASIAISKIIRGSIGVDLLKTPPSQRKGLGTISIGEFGPQDDSLCLTERPSLIMGGHKFIFFLKASKDAGYYTQTSLPIQSSKSVLRSIRKILCTGCVKPPSVRHSGKLTKKTVTEGSRVRLRCRIKGSPPPLVVWTKDETVLRRRKAMRIRNSNEADDESDEKSSVLRLRRVRLRDAGRYVCISRNIAGQARKEFYLYVTPSHRVDHSNTTESPSISSNTTSPLSVSVNTTSTTPSTDSPSTIRVTMSGHYYPCEEQTYCLNGGVCVYLPEFDAEHCRCPANYMGKRCEIRDIFTLLREITNSESQTHKRRLHIVIGIIIAIVIIIVLLVIGCYLYRRSRSRKRRKQEVTSREEFQFSYMAVPQPMDNAGMDECDGRRTTTAMTQTDPIDLALFVPSYPYHHQHHANHAPRGRSVDPHTQRPHRNNSLELRQARFTPPVRRRGDTRSLDNPTREPYLPSRANSFRTARGHPRDLESPHSRPMKGPERDSLRDSPPATPRSASTVISAIIPPPPPPEPLPLDPLSEPAESVPDIPTTEVLDVESSRSVTPTSEASLEGMSTGRSLDLDSIPTRSIQSIDLYDPRQVIPDQRMSELDSDTDVNSLSEVTDLVSDYEHTDLDEQLKSVPIIYNGLNPRTVKVDLNGRVPVTDTSDLNDLL